MHLIDVTNNYSDLVQSQLNTTDATTLRYILWAILPLFILKAEKRSVLHLKIMIAAFVKMKLNLLLNVCLRITILHTL